MTAVVINLAEVRAKRGRTTVSTDTLISSQDAQLKEYAKAKFGGAVEHKPTPPAAVELPPEPIEIAWRTSARGNPWTKIGRAHIVIFPSRHADGKWCLRLQYDDAWAVLAPDLAVRRCGPALGDALRPPH
jgi:hypothetical protein